MISQNTHFIFIATGTAGDVYPFIGLAKTFQAQGRKVTFIGSEFHSDILRKSGLPFVSFGTREEYCQRYDNPDIWNPQKGFAALFTGFSLPWRQIADALQALQTQERCVVIAHQIALPAAELVRESGANIKIVGVCLAPSNLRTCYDPLNIGPWAVPKWLPMAWRRLLWRVIEAGLIDPIAVAEVNALRTNVKGLALSRQNEECKHPPVKSYLAHTAGVADLTVMLVPEWFAGPHPDWPSPLQMASFPLYQLSPDAALPAALSNFLNAGDRPIVFTPGTGHAHADAFFRAAIVASARLKRRAIFLTPLRTQIQAVLPDTIHWQPYVCLKALLPHVAAIVHHGGIGTTAEALRAGVPQLAVPFAWDQFDNGARIAALGVGNVLHAQKLTARRLEQALAAILTSSAMLTQCAHMAKEFAAHPGIENVCQEIEEKLGL